MIQNGFGKDPADPSAHHCESVQLGSCFEDRSGGLANGTRNNSMFKQKATALPVSGLYILPCVYRSTYMLVACFVPDLVRI